VNDVLEGVLAFAPPISIAIKKAFEKYINGKNQILRDVIFTEMREGIFDNVEEEEMIGIIYRVQREAMEGSAKQNLYLMARLVCGLSEKKALTVSNFSKFANVLSGLTEDEIVLLAEIIKEYRNQGKKDVVMALDTAAFNLCKQANKDNEHSVYSAKYNPMLTALTRTGLILIRGGLADGSYHFYGTFCMSNYLIELIDYVKNWETFADYSHRK
jgi:enolase